MGIRSRNWRWLQIRSIPSRDRTASGVFSPVILDMLGWPDIGPVGVISGRMATALSQSRRHPSPLKLRQPRIGSRRESTVYAYGLV